MMLSGCATTGEADFATLEQSATATAKTTQAALENSPTLPLKIGKSSETRLELNDPTLWALGQIANYRIFEFSAPQDGRYKIDLMSLCDCIGFNKKLMRPLGFVLDGEGVVINDAPDSIGYKNETWKLPGRIEGVWSGSAQAGQSYYFLVTADNRAPGSEVTTSSGLTPAGAALIPITVSLKSAPTGKVRVMVTVE